MRLRRRQPAPDTGIDAETRAWLTEDVEVGESPWPGVMPAETVPRYEVLRCRHCQGIHFRACPRVKSLSYHENGNVAHVEFWEHYDDSDVLYPDMIFASEAQRGTT